MTVTSPWFVREEARIRSEGELARATKELTAALTSLKGSKAGTLALMDEPFARLELVDGLLVVRDYEPESARFLEAVLRRLSSGVSWQLGLRGDDVERSLSRVRSEIGVELASARLRVGVVRGHMLEISWHIPLDVQGQPERLEDAADLLCESLLGTNEYHRWVRSNHVVRSARRSALRPLAVEAEVPLFRLEAATGLLVHSIQLLRAQRSPIEDLRTLDWTVFEHEATVEEAAPQGGRVFTATRFPEATKCFLEGAHFDSSRFLSGGAILMSVLARSRPDERRAARAEIESVLQEAPYCALVGTGFSVADDYFDLALLEHDLPRLCRSLSSLAPSFSLEFWDQELRLESSALDALR